MVEQCIAGNWRHHLIHYYGALHNWIAHIHPNCDFLLKQLVNSRARPIRPGSGCLVCHGRGPSIGSHSDKDTIYNDIQLMRYSRAFNVAYDFQQDRTEPQLMMVGIIGGSGVSDDQVLLKLARKFGKKVYNRHVALFTTLAESDEPKTARVAVAVEAIQGFKEGCDKDPDADWRVANATMFHMIPAQAARGCCGRLTKKVGGLSKTMTAQLKEAGVFVSDCSAKEPMITIHPCTESPLKVMLSVCDYVIALGSSVEFKQRVETLTEQLGFEDIGDGTIGGKAAHILWVPTTAGGSGLDADVLHWLDQARGDSTSQDETAGMLMQQLHGMDSHIEELQLG